MDLSFLAGQLVVIEGGEGTGKTTQIAKLAEALHVAEMPFSYYREPGGTYYGEQIREVLLHTPPVNTSRLCNYAEMLLFCAARAQLFHECVMPDLKQGKTVLLDRFIPSTYAYQHYAQFTGLGGDKDESRKDLLAMIHEIISPVLSTRAAADAGINGSVLMCILNVSRRVAKQRKEQMPGYVIDRIEEKDAIFHDAVRNGYLRFAGENSDNTIIVDGDEDAYNVHLAIVDALRRLKVSQSAA